MITKVIQEELIQQAKRLIDKNEKFAIVTHVSPDGDAIGSSLGLYHFLCEIDKHATVLFHDAYPDNLAWMPGIKDTLVYDQYTEESLAAIAEADVIFCVDFNVKNRMGRLMEPVLASKAKRIMIDHHLGPDPICDLIISHPEISSTSELVFRLICRTGHYDDITLEGATAIYTGMMTDTGAFTYNSNSPEIYVIISHLLKKGINKDLIYNRVFNNSSESRLRLMGYVLDQKLKILPAYKTALFSLSMEELERYHYRKGESEGFVNIPLSIKDVVVSVYFRQEPEYVKVSLRSQGNFPVNLIAEKYFNGGGHKNASGGEFYGSLQEAEALLESILPLYAKYLAE